MMENKLWTVLWALLLTVNLGSTEHGNDHAPASQSPLGAEVFTGAPAADSAPAPRLEPTSRPALPLTSSDTNTSSSGTGSLTKEEEITPKPSEHKPSEHKGKNDSNIASPSVSAVPENSSNQTEDLSLQPQTLPSENQTTTSQTNSASQTITTSSPHTTHDMPVETTTYPTTPYPHCNTQPGEPKTQPPTSAPTPEPETISSTTTTTTTTTHSMSTSSTSSSQEKPITESQTLTSPHTTQSHAPRVQAKSTTAPSSSSTPQAKARADTPSQLNVGGDTMMVHESPTLDPLLAGLVTAFIITAVVITLLLFLKLRRRDNRPEFRRLQDLPMDDMMEDTPLSMYSY
ncbi:uncharacterized protein [Paralichthys olivaceus]|uniref:uncharacterized protein n=1 Tax=Paralichthys olivaceus TaxID=8255 RepID=UPI0037539BD3